MGAQPEEVSPEQIRERMADTRAQLTARVDRLKQEASPKTLLRRQLGGVRGKLHSGRERAAAPVARKSSEAADKLGDLNVRVSGSAAGAAGRLRGQVEARPMLAAVAALLVGAVTAVALPGPRRR